MIVFGLASIPPFSSEVDNFGHPWSTLERPIKFPKHDRVPYCSDYADLGSALMSRFHLTESKADLDSAIEMTERAIETSPNDSDDGGTYRTNLGSLLMSLFEKTNLISHLDRAISTNIDAVEFTPKGHPNCGPAFYNLGSALL
jgi:tetratricopeptide (TPR) repeat protein